MKAKRKWLWHLLLVPLTGVSWQIYDFTHPEPPPTVKSATNVFADAGFLTLRLTLDYHAPGSLYTVDSRSEGFVNLRPTCEVDADEVANAILVRRTIDTFGAIERKLSAGIKVAPENWSKLGIGADLAKVERILVVFSDSRVEELSTEKIRTLRNHYLNRIDCFAAVKDDLEQGYEVCQSLAVIVSDLVYEVTSRTHSAFWVEIIEIFFDLSGQSIADNSATKKISGSKMYHAVKLRHSKENTTCILLNTKTAQTGGSEPMPASGDSAAAMSISG